MAKLVIIGNRQTTGTSGGSLNTGANDVTINTEVADWDGDCTLDGDDVGFTLTAGTWYVHAIFPFQDSNDQWIVKLVNQDDSDAVLVQSLSMTSIGSQKGPGFMRGRFTISSDSSLKFIAYQAGGLNGLAQGLAANNTLGSEELYTHAIFSDNEMLSEAVLVDQKANDTDGGTSVGGTGNQRDLNTTIYDPDSLVEDLTSNDFRLSHGAYFIYAQAPSKNSQYNGIFLRSGDDSSTEADGINSYATNSNDLAILASYIEVESGGSEASRTFQINHEMDFGSAEGLGTEGDASNTSIPERFCFVLFRRLGDVPA